MRQQNAVALAENIVRELQSLSMPDAKMQINLILSDNFTENGADEIEFLFSANLGEDLKTLQKIVSGGELSRIALAVKTITAQKDDANLMVFDEVDIGVGGKTAQMMAEKIARIALTRQVICITHLPQIAAMADAHFYIHKETKDIKPSPLLRKSTTVQGLPKLPAWLPHGAYTGFAGKRGGNAEQCSAEKKIIIYVIFVVLVKYCAYSQQCNS